VNAPDFNKIAAEWVVRLDKAELPPAEMAELERWLEADERHRGAFVRARAAWSLLDRARALPAEEMQTPRRSRVPRWLAAGAAAAIACFGLWMVWPFVGPSETYSTAQHEVRRVVLSDGSVAHLDTETIVKVRMTRGRRQVELAHGTAWFDVVHNVARPFVVHAGDTNVVAVGTSFAVQRDADGVAILVTNDVVRADSGSDPSDAVRVPAGSRADVNREGRIAVREVSLGEMDRDLSWREGVINVDGQTLGEAVEQFNRYNRRRLEIRGARIAGIKIVGHFNMNDPESFARAAAPLVGGTVRVGPESIVISDPQWAEQWAASPQK
jgi:transmembrane sensor